MRLPERREMERFPLEIEECRMSCGKTEDAISEELRIENICAGGAFVKTKKQLPVGTDVTLNMVLPLHIGANQFTTKKSYISVIGEVIRTGEQGMAIGFGRKYSISPYPSESI